MVGGDVSDSEESDEIMDCAGELGIWIVIVVIWGFLHPIYKPSHQNV